MLKVLCIKIIRGKNENLPDDFSRRVTRKGTPWYEEKVARAK